MKEKQTGAVKDRRSRGWWGILLRVVRESFSKGTTFK